MAQQTLNNSAHRPQICNKNRLKAFMDKHGLQTAVELAQVFRVTQDTTSRWIRNADTKPLEDTMQGPALILFELMEDGLETKELIAMKDMAAVYANPDSFEDLLKEEKWKAKLGTFKRTGVRIETPDGYFIVVHSRWLKERVAKLKTLAQDADQRARQRRARVLMDRYKVVLGQLADLRR